MILVISLSIFLATALGAFALVLVAGEPEGNRLPQRLKEAVAEETGTGAAAVAGMPSGDGSAAHPGPVFRQSAGGEAELLEMLSREGTSGAAPPPEPGGDPERGSVSCLPDRSLGVAGRRWSVLAILYGKAAGMTNRSDLPAGRSRAESSGTSSRISCFGGRSGSARRRSRIPSPTRWTSWSSASRRGSG